MDDREQDREQAEDLEIPEGESEDVKGGNPSTGTWYLRNSNSSGAASEGAGPHVHPGGANKGFTGGA